MRWASSTLASRPYSGLLMSSLSWRSLMISMVRRSCSLTRTAYWQYQASCNPADNDARETLAMAPLALRQSA
jgi:hypothetical protein